MAAVSFALREDETDLQQPRTKHAELELLLACSRWPQREADRRLIVELAAAVPVWDRFVTLAKHHRIVPLVSRNLQAALSTAESAEPQAGMAELKRYSAASAMQSLGQLNELRRVVTALRAAAVGVRVLKGIPLAQSVFGDLSLRPAGDLDLLIDGAQLLEADRVLCSLGYTGLFDPQRFTARQLAFYRMHWKDVTYTHAVLGNELDLHWRCFRNPRMPGGDLCSSGAVETLRLGDLTIETMARREGLLYLCVHGALDGWVYLKALVDVAAQVRAMPEQELDGLAELARAHGVLPELSATLLLVRRWLAIDHWSDRLLPETDRTVRHILHYAHETLESRGFRAAREEIPIQQTLRFEWGLRRSWPYRLEVIWRVLYRARMWETIPLPDWLFWVYPLLSPVEWVLFRLRRNRGARSGLRAGNV